jgi:hypothetical protein
VGTGECGAGATDFGSCAPRPPHLAGSCRWLVLLAGRKRFICWLELAFGLIRKFHSYAVLGTPDNTAMVDAAVRRNAENKLVRDCPRFHTNDPGAAV